MTYQHRPEKDGPAYDIDVPGRPPITFPYDPETRPVQMPIFEVETGEKPHA